MKLCPRCHKTYASPRKLVCNRCQETLVDDVDVGQADAASPAVPASSVGLSLGIVLLKVGLTAGALLLLVRTVGKARYDYQHDVRPGEWLLALSFTALTLLELAAELVGDRNAPSLLSARHRRPTWTGRKHLSALGVAWGLATVTAIVALGVAVVSQLG